MDCAALSPQHMNNRYVHLQNHFNDSQPVGQYGQKRRVLERTDSTVNPSTTVGQTPSQLHFNPHQYAFPPQGTSSHFRGNNSNMRAEVARNSGLSEHMLRRKTPNGTLNGAYEGTPHNVNPLKHVLLPAQTPGDSYQEHASLPQMDSMLHQMSPRYSSIVSMYNLSVPSALQPSFNHLDPTASGAENRGPYGPYWHDGTYVPYRPAALRDPRFYGQASVGWNTPNGQLHQKVSSWQDGSRQRLTPHGSLAHSWLPSNAPFASLAGTPSMPHSFGLGHAPSYGTPVNQSVQYGSFGPVATHMNAPMNQFALPDSSGTSFALSDPLLEYGPSSSNAQQRERTFHWALQQYRDLLAFIHHTKRQHRANGPFHNNANNHRPTFFPKPPKLSGALLPISSASKSFDPIEPSRSTTQAGKQDQRSTDDSVSATDGAQDSNPNALTPKPSAIWSPGGLHFQDNEYNNQQHQLGDQRQLWGNTMSRMSDKPRTLRRSSGTIVSPIVPPCPQDDSPPSRAAHALLLVSSLCQETDWQWIDGMHLGGCLAYGLGNYQKALRWYTKVLDLDSRHLEATSNLAATLLALGRRQEAEQHWTTVVKLAPNHFEAVEHLVGLLCNEQRGKDAIKIIEYVERYLKYRRTNDLYKADSECSSSTASRSPVISELSDRMVHDFDADAEGYGKDARDLPEGSEPGYGSSGYAIPGSDNGRILSLVHAKGNMLYALGDNVNAAKAFEDAVSIACGRKFGGIQGIVKHVLSVISATPAADMPTRFEPELSSDPVLLMPEQAVQTARLCFPHFGELPGLQYLSKDPQSLSRKTAVSTTSNSLLSLAKIFQDSMSQTSRNAVLSQLKCGVRDILALYYLSLSLQPSPSTANNVGILLASVQQSAPAAQHLLHCRTFKCDIPGVVPGSGIALALAYYNYGLNLDARHAHLYTNLGSLLKDIGQLDAAIDMYKSAVRCDPRFDIALANLANAVKDKGRISEAIEFYKRAVDVSPDFAEAVCGLANALNSVCGWHARGGIAANGGKQDRWHVDQNGMLLDARADGASSSGWIKRVVDIVAKQLAEGEHWGRGTLTDSVIEDITRQVTVLDAKPEDLQQKSQSLRKILASWSGRKWEGARIIRLVERATRRLGWHWYQDKHIRKKQRTASSYIRPQLPSSLTVPTAPTVLPFHTFTCPVSAKQVRQISQRNGLRISASTLQSPWLPSHVYPPPAPPSPFLRVGYVSSDFNNHPLAHLMQSVFGMHDPSRVEAYCYATTASDSSVHRRQIEAEAPVFHDASNWSAERLVNQIVQDGIHILVNLNGYTRGARNEVFAARPAPIQMSFMGFAGTLGAEWCDYLLADETAVPPSTLRPWRRNLDLEDVVVDENSDDGDKDEDWVYGENIIYCRDTFFCCDHRQSAPDSQERRLTWEQEQKRRWQMRKELFPTISDDTIIFGNFNQLYKIEPTTFRTWLRILARVPNSILWLLRFPDLGEHHLKATAAHWAGPEVASRVIFTDVAPKHMHISRARVCDLFLDTAECNAHTTAADVLWSGTPLLTLPRYEYKMCSRMAASILKGALPPKHTPEYASAVKDLVAGDEDEYEELAVRLGNGLLYPKEGEGVGRGRGRLVELRRLLTESRWGSALFDTRRWVRDLEDAYQEAWRRWVEGEGGDIWLDKLPRGGMVVKEVGEK